MPALALDAVAIAGQAITGRLLGAGDDGDRLHAGGRMLEIGFGTGIVAACSWLRAPYFELFTDDPQPSSPVRVRALARRRPQPLNAVAFVLDGLLIGAGDLVFLARAMVGAAALFAVAAGAILVLGTSASAGCGAAIGLFMSARAVRCGCTWSAPGQSPATLTPFGAAAAPMAASTAPGIRTRRCSRACGRWGRSGRRAAVTPRRTGQPPRRREGRARRREEQRPESGGAEPQVGTVHAVAVHPFAVALPTRR